MKPRGRRPDAAQLKARKQKKLLIAGLLVLLALAGFELPKLMMKHGTKAAAPLTSTDAASADPNAPADPSAAAATPAAVVTPAPATLPDEGQATPSDGQLVTFSLFRGKDPFRAQEVDASTETTGETTPTGSAPTTTGQAPPTVPPATTPIATTPIATSSTPTVTSPPATTPTETTPVTTTSTTPAPAPKPAPTMAKISVNGVAEEVALAAAFPKAAPLFTLVSLKKNVARIGIAGGTLQGSSQTVPLVLGKTLTLMNTADGMRYVLRLVSIS
jgi:hypothetical protein